jgi:GDPmannose 4,6-dehydratase
MNQKALLIGVSGQDSSYLAELLLDKGYDVHGTVRRHSLSESQDYRIFHLGDKVKTYYADLTDKGSLSRVLKIVQPDEIYNLGAMSHVRVSFDMPEYTCSVNALGVVNLLEAYRSVCPQAKFYQASSSEQFGLNCDPDGMQRETTPFAPVSPYGCAKAFSHYLCNNYRHAYNLFISCGQLFNHESPRRGSNFVTAKIVKGAVEISLGLKKNLELGNLKSMRDWGHAKDYVRAMWMILQHDKPDNFVVSTGDTHTIEEFCKVVFEKLGMNYKDHIAYNSIHERAQELPYLKGDSSKIQKILGWKPIYTFDSLIDEMILHWQEKIKSGCIV